MRKQSIGEMALRFGIDVSCAAFMGCAAKAVIASAAPTPAIGVAATIGGACIGWTLADMCGDMMMRDIQEIGEAFAEAKAAIDKAREAEA